MSRWIPGLLLAGLLLVPMPLAAQDQATPQTAPDDTQSKPQLEQRTPPKTSGKQAVPAEEDKSFLSEAHSFNPLQSQKSIEVGDGYFKLGKYRGAAYRYQDATLWNDGNAEAWLKLGKVQEKLKDTKAAKDAYTKYLELSPESKDAPAVRKKLQAMK
jgi:tetratricopeptide (TPR) repeat protein